MYKFSEKTPQPLDQCSDETLCQLVAGGSREAEEALVTRYNRLVRTCARPFFLVGGDSEDLTQEGMVGLLKAVREYDASKEASLGPSQKSAFVTGCIPSSAPRRGISTWLSISRSPWIHPSLTPIPTPLVPAI